MPAPRILPDSGTIRQLHRKHTYAEIAKMYGVSETAVYLRVREDSPRDITPQPRYREHLPWRVKVEHMWTQPAKHLRWLARIEANGAEALPEKRRQWLANWLRKLEEGQLVVDYDPEYPPNEASPTYGGFYYVPREDQDAGGWIRRPADMDAKAPN